MFDWTTLTKDPSNKDVALKFQAFLKSLQFFYIPGRNDFLRNYFKGQRVLDIGAGEHDASCYKEERWEHGIIARAASHILGIDINPDVCAHYGDKGYNFQCVDATSATDLGERFDRVFMGDVIEHVDNPVALLQFARRHLEADGRILISTPNPFYFSSVLSRLRKKNLPFFIANFEHVSWITPTNANELARRAGLKFTQVFWPKSARSPGRRLMQLLGMPELAHREYIYEFTL